MILVYSYSSALSAVKTGGRQLHRPRNAAWGMYGTAYTGALVLVVIPIAGVYFLTPHDRLAKVRRVVKVVRLTCLP